MAYSQNDPRWKNDPLGTSKTWTMGQAGCFVTAGANVLKALGHDITPGNLNKLATAHGLINSNGDVTRWDWLAVLYPTVCRFVEVKEWPSAPADLRYLNIRNDLNTEIIIEIDDSPAPGLQTHFMRTVGWDGAVDVIVDDSWDGVRRGTSAYGKRWNPPVPAARVIYKAIKYIKVQPPKVVVTPQPIQVRPAAPPPVVTEPIIQPVPTIPPTIVEPDPPSAMPPPIISPPSLPSKNIWQRLIEFIAKLLKL